MSSSNGNAKPLVVGLLVVAISALVVGVLEHRRRMVLRNVIPPHSNVENPYEYDIEDLKRVDPALIHYVEQGQVSLAISRPTGLAVGADDTLYVVGDKQLAIMAADGKVRSTVTLPGRAGCVAVGDEAIYVGTSDHVEVYDRTGKHLRAWDALDDGAIIWSIAVSEASVFVADAGNRVILRFSKDGVLKERIGKKDKERGVPGLVVPSGFMDIGVDAIGQLWAVNPGRHLLENYAANGDIRSSWGEPSMAIEGFCGCCNPVHIAMMADGSVVTSEKGLVRIKVYNPDGSLKSVVAAPDQFKDDAVSLDLAVDSQGRVLVLDPSIPAVRVFARREKDAGEKAK
jgi:sugar lactone lactonase YvrE